MSRTTIHNRAPKACECLQQAWMKLRDLDRRIPHAILTVLTAGDRRWKHGHFMPCTWRYRDGDQIHEVGISPGLFHKPKDVLHVLLHEAAHAILREEKRNGGCTPPENYYHRKEFRDLCLDLGLECLFHNTRYGWTTTHWPRDAVPEGYKEVLGILMAGLPLGTAPRGVVRSPGKKLPKSGHIRLACDCHDESGRKCRSIYVSETILRKGGVWCAFCQSEFTAPE